MRTHRCRRWNSAGLGQGAVIGVRGADSGTLDRRVRTARGRRGSSRITSHSGCRRRIGLLAGGRCTNAAWGNFGRYHPAGSQNCPSVRIRPAENNAIAPRCPAHTPGHAHVPSETGCSLSSISDWTRLWLDRLCRRAVVSDVRSALGESLNCCDVGIFSHVGSAPIPGIRVRTLPVRRFRRCSGGGRSAGCKRVGWSGARGRRGA